MIEVKAGYKQTELGVIPEDWEVISYGEAFDFLSTASYSRADLSDNDEVFYVHYGDIHTTWSHFLDFKKYTLPTIEKIKVKNYSFMKNGDLIMADASEDYGGIGKSVEVKNITTNKAISGLHTFLLRGKEGIFVDGFKGYIHSNQLVKTSMDRLATGLKIYGVSKTNLKTIQIPRPTLPEQTAIATILSDTDALIERLEKLIAKKKAIKQGAMQQLLTGKKRLPGFSGEWEIRKLGECVTIESGESPSKFKFKNDGIPYYKVDQLNNGNKYQKDTPYFIECNNPIPKGSIIFPKRGASILLNKVRILTEDSFMDTNLMTLTTSDELNNEYLFYMLIHIELWHVADTTSIPQINNKHIKPLEIPIPSFLEQQTIATILSDMDAEIESLEQARDKYTMIKQGMMQQLLTGRIRIHGTH